MRRISIEVSNQSNQFVGPNPLFHRQAESPDEKLVAQPSHGLNVNSQRNLPLPLTLIEYPKTIPFLVNFVEAPPKKIHQSSPSENNQAIRIS